MHIALIGATGFVGSAILDEALRRGHTVTAITRHVDKLPRHDRIIPMQAQVTDTAALAKAFAAKDAVVHACAPSRDLAVEKRITEQRAGTESIIKAAGNAGVRRLLAVGGAGTLLLPSGGRNMDGPDFPKEYLGGAKSTAVIKDLLEASGLEWTFLCPPEYLVPGERTGVFRLGKDHLLYGKDGKSAISVQDYAVAMIDELETPRHTRQRFTVGY